MNDRNIPQSPVQVTSLNMNRSLPSMKALQEETDEIYRHAPRLTPVQWTLRSYSQLLMSPLLFAPISFNLCFFIIE